MRVCLHCIVIAESVEGLAAPPPPSRPSCFYYFPCGPFTDTALHDHLPGRPNDDEFSMFSGGL
jgi:hypothetical protein